jgi:hypothetical protein
MTLGREIRTAVDATSCIRTHISMAPSEECGYMGPVLKGLTLHPFPTKLYSDAD